VSSVFHLQVAFKKNDISFSSKIVSYVRIKMHVPLLFVMGRHARGNIWVFRIPLSFAYRKSDIPFHFKNLPCTNSTYRNVCTFVIS
jgi:hypothetical protein